MTEVFKGATSQTYFFELVDLNGLPKTGLIFSDVTASYVRTLAARVAIATVALAATTTAWTSGGFKEIDAANQPGVYRIDVPDAAFAAGAVEVVVTLKATGCRAVSRGFVLIAINKQLAVVPNVVAGGLNGLPLSVDTSGRVDVLKIAGTVQTARDIGAGVNVTNISGQAVFATSTIVFPAQIAAAFSRVFLAAAQPDYAPAKAGDAMSLTSDALLAIEAGFIDDTNGQAFLAAVVAKINATDVNLAGLSTATIAAGVWQYLTANATTAGSMGKRIADFLDAKISERMAASSYAAPLSLAATKDAIAETLEDLDLDTAAATIALNLDKKVSLVGATSNTGTITFDDQEATLE